VQRLIGVSPLLNNHPLFTEELQSKPPFHPTKDSSRKIQKLAWQRKISSRHISNFRCLPELASPSKNFTMVESEEKPKETKVNLEELRKALERLGDETQDSFTQRLVFRDKSGTEG
jgi:hypothetical protein